MIERISFEEFYLGVRADIGSELIKVLDPTIGCFYKSSTSYLQIQFLSDDHLFVNMLIGKGNSFQRDIKEAMKISDVKKISFMTSENNKVIQRIAKYWGFKLKGIETNYYGDSDGHYFTLTLSESKRF